MERRSYAVMGAGQVGFELARALSREGHDVTLIERDPQVAARVEESLDVRQIQGNGAHIEVLQTAPLEGCDLFMAVSSDEQANLVASLLAKRLGAKRTAVRVEAAGDTVAHRMLCQEVFDVDLLLSTQLLTTTRILNQIHGHGTMAVEYFGAGKVQLREISLDADSPLVRQPLSATELPQGSLVVALFRGDDLVVPSGEDRPEPGDKALILGETDVIDRFERLVGGRAKSIGTVVLAGGGNIARLVAKALVGADVKVRIIEQDRDQARALATDFPDYEVIYGDATDLALLQAERVDRAGFFVALTGHDETNLMASLLAQELEVPEVIALVDRGETSQLWRRLGLKQAFSPRALANHRIHDYIESGYSANIVSLSRGAAQVLERQLYPASPAAGVSLAEIKAPRGFIVGAVVRDGRAFVPRGKDRLEVGDQVILFVQRSELPFVQLLFPGHG